MIKKLLFILLLSGITASSQTSFKSYLCVDYRAIMRTAIVTHHQKILCTGASAFNDILPEVWYYDENSLAVDNGTTVLKPTELLTTEGGRYIFLYRATTGDFPIPTIATSTRVAGTSWQNTGTRPVMGVYSITASVTNPLLAGNSSVTIYGETSTNGTTWTTATTNGNTSSVALTVTLQITNGQTANLVFAVPVGQYGRIRIVTTGTASASIVNQWEMTL